MDIKREERKEVKDQKSEILKEKQKQELFIIDNKPIPGEPEDLEINNDLAIE